MQILFLLSHLRKGGLVNVVYNLCVQLSKYAEYKIIVVTLRKEQSDNLYDSFLKIGVDVLPLGSTYAGCELKTRILSRKVQRIIDTRGVDIVHCNGYHSVLVGVHLRNVNVIATLHDRANEDFINVFGPFIGRYMLLRYLYGLRKIDKCVAVSESAKLLYEQFGLHNVTCVNNGIDTDQFVPVTDDIKVQLREKYHFPLHNKIIISSGRIEKEKRYKEMVLYYDSFIKNKTISLILLGDGSQLNECKGLVGENKNIIFTGLVRNVKEYLQCADYYISYSVSEGMSMAVCEAVSCGLYPILSSIPSHHDVADVLQKDNCALVYDKIETLGSRMEDLPINVDKSKLHKYVDDNFSLKTMGRGYMKIYNEL